MIPKLFLSVSLSVNLLYDFINIKQLAVGICASAIQQDVDGIINVCSGKPVSLAQQVEDYIIDNKLDIKLKYGIYPDRPYDSPEVYGNPEKINKILGDMV